MTLALFWFIVHRFSVYGELCNITTAAAWDAVIIVNYYHILGTDRCASSVTINQTFAHISCRSINRFSGFGWRKMAE